MTEDLRISMIQSHIIWEDREENLGYYGELLRRVSGRTDLAVLPETFTTGFSMDVEKQADTMESQTVPTIKEWAKKYKLAVAGSFIAKDNGKFYNRAFFITPEGEEYYYDKRHLFRMAEEDKHFSAGDKRLIVPYKGWNICLQVCYDLRFPVWSRNVNNEYDLLIYVANWPEARKKAWKALLHARAIENMAYVCGVNRVGVDGKGFLFRGDSMIYNAKGLLNHMDEIMSASVIIAIAGMEGALASVIGGLADCPVIAVPTSVGYGASFGGVSALLSMLNSCASGVSVVNIDNGFGAGYLAGMMNHM